ncbi:S-adenosylmethionine mitochondrial carrier protein-like [Amphibalanus amphitrite]|uniref:S-adenosylmethionine mitochondrial carrier protein-like n=1 Tax=Amphibalanus amphitrite TaxID=1232801 RepID=UPI001C9293CA|nr:S-adenosylmethionine mitochondrial carrier protein-like [Amphibalanus amphitrite]XP_043213343.1 S-adenosylmethionine mitochondrial carrier protein-like [Amphibalanus amphitrite]
MSSSESSSPSLLHSFIAGGAAGLTVDVSLFPLDTLKTRLQSAEGLMRSGGLRGLYSGVGAAATGSIPTAALFFITYDGLARRASERLSPGWLPAAQGAAAAAGETVAAVVRVPVEVVKQRRQARPDVSARHIITTTLAEEGFAGMYRGFLTTVLREVPFAILQLPLWEALKAAWGRQRGRPVEPWQSGLCGGVAGGVSAAITTPLDVAKTRIMLADRHSQLASGGLVAALRIIRQENGLAGLFAGVVPRVLWISTGGSVFFGSYSLVMRLIS